MEDMLSVSASEIQNNFGEWHDKALVQPVEITHYGRKTAYLISTTLFAQLWASFQARSNEESPIPPG
jgi:PHD/YefM family antitoxin component YafN of YafNO toxin-antitoxin module